MGDTTVLNPCQGTKPRPALQMSKDRQVNWHVSRRDNGFVVTLVTTEVFRLSESRPKSEGA